MVIRIRTFAGLRDRLPASDWLQELAAGSTVADLLNQLSGTSPFLATYPVAVAVNHRLAADSTGLMDGDEVALLPPVSGG